MKENRKELIGKFQKWLGTNPAPSLIAAQCATIAQNYAHQALEEVDKSVYTGCDDCSCLRGCANYELVKVKKSIQKVKEKY